MRRVNNKKRKYKNLGSLEPAHYKLGFYDRILINYLSDIVIIKLQIKICFLTRGGVMSYRGRYVLG